MTWLLIFDAMALQLECVLEKFCSNNIINDATFR